MDRPAKGVSWGGVALLLALALYLGLALPNLRLPGLQYDETSFANAALGGNDHAFIEWEISIGGLRVPIMTMRYVGALKSWLYKPVFAVFGASPEMVRLPVIALGIITLVFSWLCAARLFGARVAAVALILLACDPSFIFCSRLDWGPVALSLALKTAGLYLLLRWLDAGGAGRIAAAGFLFGLGLFDKVIFVWFLFALAVSVPICFAARLRERIRPWALVAGVAAFLLGAAPLIAYNIRFPARTFEGQKTLSVPSAEEFAYKWRSMQRTLDGRAGFEFFNKRDPGKVDFIQPEVRQGLARWLIPGRTPLYHAWLLSVAFAILLLALRRLPFPRPMVFILLLSFVIAVFIFATVLASGPHHILMLYPLPQIQIAAVLGALLDLSAGLRGKSSSRAVWTVAAAALLALSQAALAWEYQRSFRSGGGAANWSDAIYDLGQYALERPQRPLMLMDWGFRNQLQVIAGDRIDMIEAFVPIVDADSDERRLAALIPYLSRTDALFIFHFPRFEGYPTLATFRNSVLQSGMTARIAWIFLDRQSTPIYIAYEIAHPDIEACVRMGRFCHVWEAEASLDCAGGGIELDPATSQGRFLGNHWGASTSDHVSFTFDSVRRVNDTRLRIRFDREAAAARQYEALIDGKPVAVLTLPPTRPLGDYRRRWTTTATSIGTILAGHHRLSVRPAQPDSPVLIDTVSLLEGPCLEAGNSAAVSRTPGTGYMEDMEVLGFVDRPDVRLEASPAEAIAGKDTVTLRLFNFESRQVDVLYEIDGRRQPILYNWALDARFSSRIALASDTPRGLYRYLAIRDSHKGLPLDWILVDASVRVK